jgi:hypothetical protein
MAHIPVVTFGEIDRALNGAEAVGKTPSIVESKAESPSEAAVFLAGLAKALEELQRAEKVPGVLTAPDHPIASLLQSFIAENAMTVADLPIEGKEAKFDEKDWLGWAGSLFAWWKGIKKHAWNPTPDDKAIANKARIAILGDWGTGLYGAPVATKTIREDAKGYQVLLHLGDVYYSGTEGEVKNRFLALWPDMPEGVVHRACNSNHEMYAGGYGYFDQTLVQFDQAASYFALHNDHFVILGLDTGYKEKDLHGDQADWVQAQAAAAGGRKVILLSHHQPYSLFEAGHPGVTGKLEGVLSARQIFAWYWGHEHRCVLFDAHPAWGVHGRCVGHSGFPYFRDALTQLAGVDAPLGTTWRRKTGNGVPDGIVLDGPNPYLAKHETKYGTQGYMTLELDGEHLNEVVHAPDGTELYSKPLA